jgi:hypothetical protein
MSLFNLTHKNVVVKFGDSAAPKFDSTASYVFHLTGVDGMGFLEIQDLKPGKDGVHEAVGEPYWINKDLIVELFELKPETAKSNLRFTGQPAKAAPKPKAPAKPKPAVI